jgi:DNA-binding transcriptional LysR family regulator
MLHYSLIDLQAFCAIADENNLTRGAERVHLSPSTVSTRIKNLEQSLGARLLNRRARGVELTPAGDIVRQAAIKVEAELSAMERDLQPFVLKESGTVRVVTNFGAAVNFLAPGVAKFLQENPGVSFVQERTNSTDVVRAVAEDRADLGMGAYVGTYPNVDFVDLADDDLVLAVSKQHPLARRKNIGFAECLSEPFLCLDPSSEMQRFLYDRARELGHPIVPKLQLATQTILLRLVAEGIGVGIVSRVAYERVNAKGTKIIYLSDDWAKRKIRIAIPHDPAQRSRWTEPLVAALKAALAAR